MSMLVVLIALLASNSWFGWLFDVVSDSVARRFLIFSVLIAKFIRTAMIHSKKSNVWQLGRKFSLVAKPNELTKFVTHWRTSETCARQIILVYTPNASARCVGSICGPSDEFCNLFGLQRHPAQRLARRAKYSPRPNRALVRSGQFAPHRAMADDAIVHIRTSARLIFARSAGRNGELAACNIDKIASNRATRDAKLATVCEQ